MKKPPHVTVAALLVLCGVLGALAGDLLGQEKKAIRTRSVEDAGPDFLVQGEYVGEIELEGGKTKVGIQVIARGGGAFEAAWHRGGLPGDGWDGAAVERSKEKDGVTGADGATVFEKFPGERRLEIRGGRLTVKDAGGKKLGELERVLRRSPTLGQKPPAGAVVLFDEGKVNRFVRNGRDPEKSGKAMVSPEGYLLPRADSEVAHGDVTLHLEFMLPFEPAGRGQGRANSGCYLQGRHEVQILDSFGLALGAGDCGAVYGVAIQKVNMCFPPLSWQTYDIEYTAARFDAQGKRSANARLSVRHNGVLIHDKLDVNKDVTTAATEKEGPEKRYLHLQDHGHQVMFRNIWLVEK
jgi:hypothetical protein